MKANSLRRTPTVELKLCTPDDAILLADPLRLCWNFLLTAEPRLGSLYPPGEYYRRQSYNIDTVSPFAEIAGAAQCDDATLERVLRRVIVRKDTFIMGLKEDGELAGFIVGHVEDVPWRDEPTGNIEFTFVAPEFRRCGYLRTLMRFTASHFRDRGCNEMWGVLLKANEELGPMWKTLAGEPWAQLIIHTTDKEAY